MRLSTFRREAVALCALLSSRLVLGQALGEPAGNQIMFGAWIDTAHDGITPFDFNRRMNKSYSVFQIAQDMPLPEYDWVTGEGGPAPEWMIEQTQTSAAVFLTVYPLNFNQTQADWDILGSQLVNYTETLDRTTFLRFAPEMQGTWFPYGFQPLQYVQMWIRMYREVKRRAPRTIIVWAPNEGFGYPYGQIQPNLTEFRELDTTGDGTLGMDDDPFAPYYPGDEYVDWIGMSIYYKGPNYGENINTAQDVGFCAEVLSNIDPVTSVQHANFYDIYCTKPGKACMVAESGAAYHVDVPGGAAAQLAMQRRWWEDCMVNNGLLDRFPRLKLWMHFEYEKIEDGDDLRDYRMVNSTAILQPFSAAVEDFSTRVAWATSRTLPPNIPSSGVPPGITGGSTSSVCTKYCGQVIFTTGRNPATGAPSLFGHTRASSAARLQAGIAVGATSIAMVGAMVWLAGRPHHRQVASP